MGRDKTKKTLSSFVRDITRYRRLRKSICGVQIVDNWEQLVPANKYNRSILLKVDNRIRRRRGIPENMYLRDGVAKRLAIAQKLLPAGYKLLLVDGYRTIERQRSGYWGVYNAFKAKNPLWADRELRRETEKFVAPYKMPHIPPHTTGGAVDLTVIGSDGREHSGWALR
jgi:hypothetical protein